MSTLPYEAAERIERLIRERFDAASIVATRKKLLPILREAEKELETRLAKAASGGTPFTAAQAAAYRVQVRKTIDTLAKHVGNAVGDLAESASGESIHAMTTQLRLAQAALGAAPETALSVQEIARLTGAFGGNTSLLQHFYDRGNASALTYGQGLIGGFEGVIAKGLASGKTTDQVSNDLQGGHPDGFQGAWWKAERIGRTEISYAYNVTAREGAQKLGEELPDVLVRWVEFVSDTGSPLDDRVGEDSLRLHGQLRWPGQPFHDVVNKRDVTEPPNRPNDRATLATWRASWGEPPGGLARLDAESQTVFAEALAKLAEAKQGEVDRKAAEEADRVKEAEEAAKVAEAARLAEEARKLAEAQAAAAAAKAQAEAAALHAAKRAALGAARTAQADALAAGHGELQAHAAAEGLDPADWGLDPYHLDAAVQAQVPKGADLLPHEIDALHASILADLEAAKAGVKALITEEAVANETAALHAALVQKAQAAQAAVQAAAQAAGISKAAISNTNKVLFDSFADGKAFDPAHGMKQLDGLFTGGFADKAAVQAEAALMEQTIAAMEADAHAKIAQWEIDTAALKAKKSAQAAAKAAAKAAQQAAPPVVPIAPPATPLGQAAQAASSALAGKTPAQLASIAAQGVPGVPDFAYELNKHSNKSVYDPYIAAKKWGDAVGLPPNFNDLLKEEVCTDAGLPANHPFSAWSQTMKDAYVQKATDAVAHAQGQLTAQLAHPSVQGAVQAAQAQIAALAQAQAAAMASLQAQAAAVAGAPGLPAPAGFVAYPIHPQAAYPLAGPFSFQQPVVPSHEAQSIWDGFDRLWARTPSGGRSPGLQTATGAVEAEVAEGLHFFSSDTSNCAYIRDPSKAVGRGASFLEKSKRASRLVDTLSRRPRPPTTIYRGMENLPQTLYDKYKPGAVVDLGNGCSFTFTEREAHKFSSGSNPIILIWENATEGTDISKLSYFPTESEIFAGGPVEILDVQDRGGKRYCKVRRAP